MKRKCCRCKKLTENWHRINNSPWHCYDGCYSTTGLDHRYSDGIPLSKFIEGTSAYTERLKERSEGYYYPTPGPIGHNLQKF